MKLKTLQKRTKEVFKLALSLIMHYFYWLNELLTWLFYISSISCFKNILISIIKINT